MSSRTESGVIGQFGDGYSLDSDLESLLGNRTEFKGKKDEVHHSSTEEKALSVS